MPQADHYIYMPGDVDYVMFHVNAPVTYTIWTTRTLSFSIEVNTTLTLYGPDDDSIEVDYNVLDPYNWNHWPFSKIVHFFDTGADGLYFVKVADYEGRGDCHTDYMYTLEITNTALSSSLPEGVAYLTPRLQMMYERMDVFLPIYWKEWDSLGRFRP